MGTTEWTLDQLGTEVRTALSVGYTPASSGRVKAVPDRRTIRYYTTLGLLDRPAAMRGRTAYYGKRHLLQLVAIKRLQARGLSLTQVQERLAGLSDKALAKIAVLPEADAVSKAREEPAPSRREAFWEALPAAVGVADAAPTAAPAEVAAEPLATLTGITLTEGVTLLLGPLGRSLGGDDLSAIRQAAEPLLTRLQALGLLD